MKELLWQLVARLLACKPVADWLIKRAQRTPYFHITGPTGEIYMGRWWLFNAYEGPHRSLLWRWVPFAIRVHHICRADSDPCPHDHPWNARTIILRGSYVEKRVEPCSLAVGGVWVTYRRHQGQTAKLNFGEFHRIDRVSQGGVYTLFITGRYRGTWGFLSDTGQKVPWREYLGIGKEHSR